MKKIMKAALLAMVLCLVLSAVTGCQYLEQLQSLINPTEPTEHVHTLTKMEGYPATCVNNGIIDNWSCLVCGKRFADAEATQEVTFADMEIVHDGKSGHGAIDHEGKCELCHKYAAPAVGTAFQLKLYQANIDKTLYFSGAKSGNFLATGDVTKATALYLEAAEGGYYIYFMNSDTKNYVDVYEYQEGSIGVTVSDEPHGIWVFDHDLGVFTVTMCERTVYLGTYGTYNTMSLSDTFRISGDKAGDVGVSQFVARAVVISEHECKYSEATCTKLAACTICGLPTGELKAHTYVEGVCSCGAKEPVAGALNITKDSFSSVSYADNNKAHAAGEFEFTSNQVMNQQGVMQWQKSKGYITVSGSYGFTKLEMVVTAGTFTVTVGGQTVTGTTVDGVTTYDFTGLTGDIKVAVGSATGKVDYLTFTK